jgi:DNA-binding transcriptional MocR family regulator
MLKPTLYGDVADRVLSLIEAGTFRAGDKLPSIRTLSGRFAVSVNTVKEAYGLLETQRFLEARPQSGYYVRRSVPPLPKTGVEASARRRLDPRDVSMCHVYGEITRDGRAHPGASLAIALPDPALLPAEKLNAAFHTAWKTLGRSMTDYALSPGLPLLREQIAQEALQAGMVLSPDDIVVTSGTSEAITLTLLSLCRAGDTVAIETPTYFNFLSLLKELGVRVLEIPATPEEGVDLELLTWAFDTHAVKAFVTIANFNNPLGYRLSDDRKKALVELCRRKGVPLVEDDIYGDLPFAGPRPRTCKSFDADGSVILVSGFSKTLAPGYRIGWTVPGRWYNAIDKLKSLTSVATATPTQWAVGRFLETGGYQRHLRSLRQKLADQVGIMAEAVARSFPEGTRVSRPAGGFVLWVELPEPADTTELYGRALAEGIVFSPGEIFSASGRFRNAMRLNAGVWNEGTARAVERLGRLAGGGT